MLSNSLLISLQILFKDLLVFLTDRCSDNALSCDPSLQLGPPCSSNGYLLSGEEVLSLPMSCLSFPSKAQSLRPIQPGLSLACPCPSSGPLGQVSVVDDRGRCLRGTPLSVAPALLGRRWPSHSLIRASLYSFIIKGLAGICFRLLHPRLRWVTEPCAL